MRNPLLLLISIFYCSALLGQGSWTQLNDFPGDKHFTAAKFKIKGKLYLLEGHNSSTCYDRLWQFDPKSGSWSQKATFPGNLTKGDPVGFSIDSMGYIGTGKTCSDNQGTAFWSYDPSTDSWTQKADVPASSGIVLGIGFAIDGKGYIGLGRHAYNDPNNELYRYDPTIDAWSPVATFPGNHPSSAEAVTSGNKAYIATGGNASGGQGSKAFWQYDPSNDSWTQLSDFPGAQRKASGGFGIYEHIYFGGGWNGSQYYQDFYRYNTQTDNWTQVSDFGGGLRRHTEEVAIDGKAYVIGGMDDQGNFRKDVWEYRSEFVSQQEFDEEELVFTVHPNPATDQVTIQQSKNGTGVKQLRILSPEGKVLKSQDLEGEKTRIDVSTLSTGLYFVEIKSEEGKNKVKKLMVE